MPKQPKTIPKPRGVDSNTDPFLLTAGRYGTDSMAGLLGRDKTYEFNLKAQGMAVHTLSTLHPDIVPPGEAQEVLNAIPNVKPERIAELEEQTGHDVIAVNSALGELVSGKAKSHINKTRTSADTTETAKGIQLKGAIEIIADSAENLRDIVLERALEWIDEPHMDVTHLYDALPTVAGRPFAFYAEMLQSDLDLMKFIHGFSLLGK